MLEFKDGISSTDIAYKEQKGKLSTKGIEESPCQSGTYYRPVSSHIKTDISTLSCRDEDYFSCFSTQQSHKTLSVSMTLMQNHRYSRADKFHCMIHKTKT